ncbi:MFS general substrate transporter [Dendrothele bispora CBS 962.96]|uniref:MFS general substrate transporter n=1 Tax=Dendrothele bispora (strain CBS 962.96) TaxID=1314807 RepID=A0A4S8MV69_DENBC|nr:MFS general substrate transporter [Dendrothele bispora CBS 962.96]
MSISTHEHEHDPLESETATRVDDHNDTTILASTPPSTPSAAAHDPSSSSSSQPPVLTDQTNLLPFKQVIIVFVSLSFCTVVSALDSVIIATSLSTVAAHFNAGAVISWVPSAYLMTSTAFQPLYGRFSDIFGRKAAMGLAMSIYMIGNLIAGFSNSIIQVIVFRGVAGAGGGGIIGMMQIIISDIITLRERGKYQGIIGGVVAVGYTIGPIIGGVLAQKVSWRWCFWITLPLSLFATCVVMVALPLKRVEGDMKKKLLIVDYFGTFLTLIGCTLIMLPLIWGGVTFPWTSPTVLAPLFCGLLVVCVFCVWEWKGARLPIVPMYIFKHATVTGVYITMFVNGFVFFSTIYYIPQFFQVALGYTPLRAGIFLIPVVIGQMVASWIAGLTVSRTGRYRAIVYIGFAVLSIASGCISTFSENSSRAAMVVLMLLCGCGSGMTMQTTTVAAQASVARKDMSVVTAVRNFLRMLGGAVSLPVASSLVNNALRSSMTPFSFSPSTITTVINDPTLLSNSTLTSSLHITPPQVHSILTLGYTKGFSDLFVLNGCMAAGATIVAFWLIKHKELMRGDEGELREKARREYEERERKVREAARVRRLGGAEKGSVPPSGTVTPRDLEMGQVPVGAGDVGEK